MKITIRVSLFVFTAVTASLNFKIALVGVDFEITGLKAYECAN